MGNFRKGLANLTRLIHNSTEANFYSVTKLSSHQVCSTFDVTSAKVLGLQMMDNDGLIKFFCGFTVLHYVTGKIHIENCAIQTSLWKSNDSAGREMDSLACLKQVYRLIRVLTFQKAHNKEQHHSYHITPFTDNKLNNLLKPPYFKCSAVAYEGRERRERSEKDREKEMIEKVGSHR